MARIVFSLLLLFTLCLTAGCQAFLEDYSYQPVQGMSSNGY